MKATMASTHGPARSPHDRPGTKKLIYIRPGEEAIWEALARYARAAGMSGSAVVGEALAAYRPLAAFVTAEDGRKSGTAAA